MDSKDMLKKVLSYKSVTKREQVEEYIKENPMLIGFLLKQLHFDRNLQVVFVVDEEENVICYTKTLDPNVQFKDEKFYMVYNKDEETKRQAEEAARNKQRKTNTNRK